MDWPARFGWDRSAEKACILPSLDADGLTAILSSTKQSMFCALLNEFSGLLAQPFLKFRQSHFNLRFFFFPTLKVLPVTF